MSDEETITVELTRDEAEALAHTYSPGKGLHTSASRKAAAALVEHDATTNALALPWEIELIGPGNECCVKRGDLDIIDLRAWRDGEHLTLAQAKLITAAPEMADALEILLKPRAETLDGRLAGDHARRVARAALRKAGR